MDKTINLETVNEAGDPVMDCDMCPDFFTCDNMGWYMNCPHKHKEEEET